MRPLVYLTSPYALCMLVSLGCSLSFRQAMWGITYLNRHWKSIHVTSPPGLPQTYIYNPDHSYQSPMSELPLETKPPHHLTAAMTTPFFSYIFPRRRSARIRRPQLIPTRRKSHKPQTSAHIPPRHITILDSLDIRKHLPRRRPVLRRAGQETPRP